jgi:hypothetical protein
MQQLQSACSNGVTCGDPKEITTLTATPIFQQTSRYVRRKYAANIASKYKIMYFCNTSSVFTRNIYSFSQQNTGNLINEKSHIWILSFILSPNSFCLTSVGGKGYSFVWPNTVTHNNPSKLSARRPSPWTARPLRLCWVFRYNPGMALRVPGG